MWKLLLLSVVGGVDIVFPVEDVESDPLYLTIPATLAVESSNVTLHATIACDPAEAVPVRFDGSSGGNVLYPMVSYFTLQKRADRGLKIVCVDGGAVGHLEYHEMPVLQSDRHPMFPKQTIEVREFVNFGWDHKFPPIVCKGCRSSINTLAFKSVVKGNPACSGRREQHNPLFNVSTSEGAPIHVFPFFANITIDPVTGLELFEARSVSRDHLSIYDESMEAIKTPIELCFYSDSMAGSGIYLGEAEFMLSQNDTSALVFFLLFIGILFPIIMIVTTVLHCYKLTRHRQFARSVKNFIQGLQLEREMLLSSTGNPVGV